MSTLSTDFNVGQKLKIRTGWYAGCTATVRAVTPQRITVALSTGMLTDWRTDVAGWMPSVEVIK